MEKPKWQSIIDNPEKLATLGTEDARRRQSKQKTQHNMCWTPPYKRHKTKTRKLKKKKTTIPYVQQYMNFIQK
jgi:hypothetical protein